MNTLRRTASTALSLVVLIGFSTYPQVAAQGNGGGVRIDWTISFGTLIHLFVLVASITFLYSKLVARIVGVEQKVSTIYVWLEALVPHVEGVRPEDILKAHRKAERG